MTDDELRDASAVAILPTTLQMNIHTVPGLAGQQPKHNVNLASAVDMAFAVGDAMVAARAARIVADEKAKAKAN